MADYNYQQKGGDKMLGVTWMYRDPETWTWTSENVPVFRSEREAEEWLNRGGLPIAIGVRLVEAPIN